MREDFTLFMDVTKKFVDHQVLFPAIYEFYLGHVCLISVGWTYL